MYLASTYQRNLFKQNDERNNKEEMIMDLYVPHQSAGIIWMYINLKKIDMGVRK